MECRLSNQLTRSVNARGACRRLRLDYLVTGAGSAAADSGAAVITAVGNVAPELLDHARRRKIEIVRCSGNGTYEVAVEYELSSGSRSSGRRIGDASWSFDAAGGTARVYSGTLIRSGAPAGETAPDPGGAVQWNGRAGEESHVAGTEKVAPALRESCTVTFRASKVSSDFKRNIMSLTGCVNSVSFHGWEAGEVLFLGASSGAEYENENGVELIDVTYRFAVRPNRTKAEIDGLTLGSVSGWDCLWSIEKTDPRTRSRRAAGAYATRIYDSADLKKLGF